MLITFKRLGIPASILLLIFTVNCVQASCGTTACSINAEWNEQASSQQGWSADLRYSYSRADTLRSGSNKIAADPAAAPYNSGIEAENLRTINQIVTASLSDLERGVVVSIPAMPDESAKARFDDAASTLLGVARRTELPERYRTS